MFFFSCAENIERESFSNFEACDYIIENTSFINSETISFGTDSTLDIITWNVENFPKDNIRTVDYIAKLIDSMNVDIIAMQEIGSESYFISLLNTLEGWDGQRTSGAYGLAYLYKSDLTVNSLVEIEELDDYNLTRTPYMLELNWGSEIIYIINNHYKCCGDGIIENISYDEEYRRLEAVRLTKNYIINYKENENVILLGDLNDLLSDNKSNNVFWELISDSANYRFTDLQIACNSSNYWSYPTWPSHLDHILITNELFDEFERLGSGVQTIQIEDYLYEGWDEYETFVSDHRPVGLSLVFDPN